jgi:hypothetical protein
VRTKVRTQRMRIHANFVPTLRQMKISTVAVYGVYIFQLIRYSRACGSYRCD